MMLKGQDGSKWLPFRHLGKVIHENGRSCFPTGDEFASVGHNLRGDISSQTRGEGVMDRNELQAHEATLVWSAFQLQATNRLAAHRYNKRSESLFRAMVEDTLLRDQFVTDPARIL